VITFSPSPCHPTQIQHRAQMKTGQCALLCAPLPQPPSIHYHNPPTQYNYGLLSCPLVSIPHPLPGPKRVGIQIPLASYSPAPPSLIPSLHTIPLHLTTSVTWLGYLDGPVLWLAIYLFIYHLAIPCPHPSIMEPNKWTICSTFYLCDHQKYFIIYNYTPINVTLYCF
jgi:hypothetical protein